MTQSVSVLLHRVMTTLVLGILGSQLMSCGGGGGGDPSGKGSLPTLNVQLLDDLTTTPRAFSSNISEPVELNGWIYFAANNGSSGIELWRSNGVTAEQVADINPGEGSSGPSSLTPMNGYLYFTASNATNGRELWRTNGSTTSMVADIEPGAGSSSPSNLTVFNNQIYFKASSSAGVELWRSDGAITEVVMPASAGSNPYILSVFNNQLYYSATTNFESRLFRTNGSSYEMFSATATTDFFLPYFSSSPNVVSGGYMYFAGSTSTSGTELLRTNGTTIELVSDIYAGFSSSNPQQLTVYNGQVYFTASTGNGRELWRTNGTMTAEVANIYSGANGSNPNGLTVYNGWLYFSANDGTNGTELWRSNGTTTTMFANIASGPGYSNPQGFIEFNGALYFNAAGADGAELWRTDGTTTEQVMDIYPGISFFTNSGSPENFFVFNSELFFTATDGITGSELWHTDGTTTELALELNSVTGTYQSILDTFTELNGQLYFIRPNNSIGYNSEKLWRVDGNTAVVVTNVDNGNDSYVIYNGQLYFTLWSSSAGTELWRTTTNGTELVQDINTGSTGSNPHNLTLFNGYLYFSATTAAEGNELFRYDGNTVSLVTDINTGTNSSNPQDFIVFNDYLYFVANNGVTGKELWRTNGTSTEQVMDINPGSNGSVSYSSYGPSKFTVFNGHIYFAANDGVSGLELWRTDGTTTEHVYDTTTGLGISLDTNNLELVVIGSRLYFVASSSTAGLEVWSTDGITTKMITDLNPGDKSSYPQHLVSVNGYLYFSGFSDSPENEMIYRTNGTSIEPISAVASALGSNNEILDMVSFDNQLFFVTYSEALDQELWRTDGSSVERVTQFSTNSNLVNFNQFKVVGQRLYFAVDDGVHGNELWYLERQ